MSDAVGEEAHDEVESRRGYSVETLGQAGGALIGTVLGGPIGAALGAAAGVSLTRLGMAVVKRVAVRSAAVLRPAMEALGSEAALAERLEIDDNLAFLAVRLLDDASSSSWDAHVSALALVLRDAAVGATTIPDAVLMADALARLRPQFLPVLQLLAENPPPEAPNSMWSYSLLCERTRLPPGIVHGALRALEDSGGTEVIMRSLFGGMGEEWRMEPFGRRVLAYIAQA